MNLKNKTFIDLLFIICGGKFYLDYILPTNSQSKNPIVRIFSSLLEYDTDYKTRYISCYVFGGIHIVGLIAYFYMNISIILNILINIYPIVVQLYIGYRIVKIMKHKRKIKKLILSH